MTSSSFTQQRCHTGTAGSYLVHVDVDLQSAGDELHEALDLVVPFRRGGVQRCFSLVVPRVHVGPAVQQQFDGIALSEKRGSVQSPVAVVVAVIDICPLLDQEPGGLDLADQGGQGQGGSPVFVRLVDVGAAGHVPLDGRKVAGLGGVDNRIGILPGSAASRSPPSTTAAGHGKNRGFGRFGRPDGHAVSGFVLDVTPSTADEVADSVKLHRTGLRRRQVRLEHGFQTLCFGQQGFLVPVLIHD